jgi:hypothetical protein
LLIVTSTRGPRNTGAAKLKLYVGCYRDLQVKRF